MASQVSICSNALLMLGDKPINDLVPEEGDRAVLALNLFPDVRDGVLRAHTWDCAIKRALLSPLSAAPAFGWSYQFQLPADCLRVISVAPNNGEPIEHSVEGDKLLCNTNVVYLRYIFRNQNVEAWDAGLVSVVTAAMARDMAYPITRSAAMRDTMQNEYLLRLRMQRAADSLQGTPDQIQSSPFISVRGIGG